MPNKNYIKGRRKEYELMKMLKDMGFDIVARSAGSHSKIDVWAINKTTRKILLIQSKPDNFSDLDSSRIYKELEWLKGDFNVEFIIR